MCCKTLVSLSLHTSYDSFLTSFQNDYENVLIRLQCIFMFWTLMLCDMQTWSSRRNTNLLTLVYIVCCQICVVFQGYKLNMELCQNNTSFNYITAATKQFNNALIIKRSQKSQQPSLFQYI